MRVDKHVRVDGRELDPRLRRLREYQAARLARTHADLLADPKTADAGRFFLSDVYAAKDFSQRDHDITRLYDTMRAVLPSAMARALELVIELNAITAALDDALADALAERLGDADPITEAAYAEAYRACDNYDDRTLQIDLVVGVGAEIESLVHKPGIGIALKLARGPAYLAGWHEMQNFFERGFAAFRKIRGAGAFLDTIATRERAILDEIYACTGPR